LLNCISNSKSSKTIDPKSNSIWECNRFFPWNRDQFKENLDSIVIVNSQLPPHFTNFWDRANKKVCADGGANKLYDYWNNRPDGDIQRAKYIPTVIKGDLDSARKEVLSYYADKGALVVPDHDQNTTDLQKCLNDTEDNDKILILGGGGNLSHEMANINTILLYPKKHISLLSPENLLFFLGPGKHEIQCQAAMKVALIPMGRHCDSVTTDGLKWNLKNSALRFGGLISTSNEMAQNTAHVNTSDTLLWTCDYKDSAKKLGLSLDQLD